MALELAATANGTTHMVLPQTLLDQVYEKLTSRRVQEGMDQLMPGLRARRLALDPQEWSQAIQACRQHPVRELLHQDPFTFRAYSKPRGYAGDAVLLDFVYGREEDWPPPEGTSELGRMLFEYLTLTPACEGVRARRGFIAELLDRLMDEVSRPHVLSLAAGHLREADLSSAVKRKKFGRYVALDSDPDSLKEIERCYGRCGVEPCLATIRQLLTQKVQPGLFDVVYSTGLFDYLQQSTSQRLTSVMFRMLRPGGRLLVANFMPGIADVGYMESFMDWKLVYRTRQEMLDVAAELAQGEIRDIRLFAEENQNILFLQVTKK